MERFLFVEGRRARVRRHFAFWSAWIVVTYVNSLYLYSPRALLYPHVYYVALVDMALCLPLYIFSTYIFLYVSFPVFIAPRRYILFFASVLVMMVVNSLLGYVLSILYFDILNPGNYPWLERARWQTGYGRGGQAVVVSCIATGIKVALAWKKKQAENTDLIRRKSESDLQLAKTMIRPEFLLHSLESIHEKLMVSYDISARMILKLSDVFSFVLYDCKDPHILLVRELEALDSLIEAESISRGQDLRLSIKGEENARGKYVQPLLLFSFVQGYLAAEARSIQIDITEHQLLVRQGGEVAFHAIPLYKPSAYAHG
jgi:hypothetical protein